MQEKEELETVAQHCKHIECIYRSQIDGGNTPICFYAVLANEPRGCKISECDKYKAGRPLKPRIKDEYMIFWEREIYGEDADVIW